MKYSFLELERLQRLRRQANYEVRRALGAGELKKPKRCVACWKPTRKLEAHHDDYGQPLEVSWLCLPCHRQKHREARLKVYIGSEA
jgi:hypothetical protein